MKNTTLSLTAILLLLASCKKDYTCSCDMTAITESTNPSVPFRYESEFDVDFLFPKEKKKDAKALCEKAETEYKEGHEKLNTPGGAIAYSVTGGCELE